MIDMDRRVMAAVERSSATTMIHVVFRPSSFPHLRSRAWHIVIPLRVGLVHIGSNVLSVFRLKKRVHAFFVWPKKKARLDRGRLERTFFSRKNGRRSKCRCPKQQPISEESIAGRSRRTFKNASTQTADAVFVRSRGNVHSSGPFKLSTVRSACVYVVGKTKKNWHVEPNKKDNGPFGSSN